MAITPIQYQRKANPLEGLMNALQVPNNIVAGATDAVLHGSNPIHGAQDFIQQHRTFQDTLTNAGITGAGAVVGGLALDILGDPLSYVGIGELTGAGRAAKAARTVLEHGAIAGDIDKVAKGVLDVTEHGSLAATRAEQALAGQRGLFSFAGKELVPRTYAAKVYSTVDNIAMRVGDTSAGRAFNKMFINAANKVPLAMKLRNIEGKAAITQTLMHLEEDLGRHGSEFYKGVKSLGLDTETARDILRDTIELSGKSAETVDLTKYMSPSERRKYVRFHWQAEAAKRGIPTTMHTAQQTGGEIEGEFIAGRMRRPRRYIPSKEPLMTESASDLTALDTPANLAAVRKSRRRPRNVSPAPPVAIGQTAHGIGLVSEEVTKRGNQVKRLAQPNLFGLPDSWDRTGTMPEELASAFRTQGFENTYRAVRRLEDSAIKRYHVARLNDALKAVKTKYGHEFVSGLDPLVARAVHYINLTNMTFLQNERDTGLKVSELISDLNYLKHAITPEARQALIDSGFISRDANSYEVSVRFASQLQRDEKLRTLTVSEINELGETGQLTGLLGRKKIKLFEDEPFHATFIRGTESAKTVQSAAMLRDALGYYGKIVGDGSKKITNADLPIGHRFLSTRLMEDIGWSETETFKPFRVRAEDGTVIQDVAVPHDIADLLESQYERIITPKMFQPILRSFDAITRAWKNITLPIWPAYQTRNLMSDLTLITWGANEHGLMPHQAVRGLVDAMQGLFNKAETIQIGEKTWKWDDLHELMNRFGILDYSPARDLDEHIARPFGLPRFDRGIDAAADRLEAVGIGNIRPIEMGIRFGMARQNATNAGYFIELLRKGLPPEQAALEVKARLFDYTDLTDFERQVLRRVFPFYSWLRHNLPYQINAAIQTPRTVAAIPKIREATSALSGDEGPAGDVPLPGFLRDALPLRLGGDPLHPQFARLQGLIPQGDLGYFNDPLDAAITNTSPFLKVPVEIASNFDPWQKQPLERFPGEMDKRVGIPIPKRLTPIVDMVRPVNELNSAFFRPGEPIHKLESLMYARSYRIDKEVQFRLMAKRLKENDQDAKRLLQAAVRKGDTKNIIAIRRWIKDLHEHPTRVLR